MHAWVVMPNHVHALFTPEPGWTLSAILHSWKSYSAHAANRMLGQQGRFWHADYFDRFVRDARHYEAVRGYIERNPVKAKLCRSTGEWRFGSAGWKG